MKLTKNIGAMLVASSLLVSTNVFAEEDTSNKLSREELIAMLDQPPFTVPESEENDKYEVTKGDWAQVSKTVALLAFSINYKAHSDDKEQDGGIIYNLKHLSNWAAAAQTNIEELEKHIPFDLSRLTAIETKLAALQQREPSDYAAAIARNAASISQLNQRVAKVEKNLKQGLATQAALAGLFQPYNVGKVNVTAAVGGHRSEAAVAVGAGYRLNERFAAKTGVAVNSSGLSYNVGVNFEF